MATRMRQRRGTAAEWAALNPVLADGEIGFARDTNVIKIGDGVKTWSELTPVQDTYFATEQELADLSSSTQAQFNNYVPLSQKAAASGVATLDGSGFVPEAQLSSAIARSSALTTKADLVSGKIPTSQLPALAITDTFVAESQAAMLALTAERGDVAIRTDLGTTYILLAEPATTLANWRELPAAGKVTSVNGQQGIITLTKADVGLGNADNTSDANKPISTATQSALDAKAPKQIGIPADKTANYTLVLNDQNTSIGIGTTTNLTLTIPADTAVNFPIGALIEVRRVSTGEVAIAPASGVTLNTPGGLNLRVRYSAASLLKVAANTWSVQGDLS